jgi:hypothetical protein
MEYRLHVTLQSGNTSKAGRARGVLYTLEMCQVTSDRLFIEKQSTSDGTVSPPILYLRAGFSALCLYSTDINVLYRNSLFFF